MKLDPRALGLDGCHAVHLPTFGDDRGGFQKLFHAEGFGRYLPGFLPREAYLTTSARGVLRGMHFQLPPHDHGKVVVCLGGAVTDVLLDLRPGPGYGAVASVDLTPGGENAVLIPKGIAHGFYAREDNSALLYLVETVHAPDHDAGLMWNSFGFDWPDLGGPDLGGPNLDEPDLGDPDRGPILSARDTAHPVFADFTPPASWAL